jgi:DNA replication licensing factor MCM5
MYGDLEFSKPVVLEPPDEYENWGAQKQLVFGLDGATSRIRFREFFRNFRQDGIHIYRDALVRHWNRNEMFVEVDLAHLNEFDEVLFNNLQSKPNESLPFFEAGAKDALKQCLTTQNQEQLQTNLGDFQIILKSDQNSQSLRSLTAEHINTLIKVPGIVISCSKVRSKAVEISIKCTKCQSVKRLPCRTVMGGTTLPTKCDRNGAQGDDCGFGTYVIMADHCEYIDQQTLRLQECPEVVPTGELPRAIMLAADRHLVDRVTPGTRVSVIGIASLFNSSSNGNSGGASSSALGASVRTPFLRVLGMQLDGDGGPRCLTSHFTLQDEEEMQALARDPDIYHRLASSIAPQISGEYTHDIKKAIACLLVGGSRKLLPDGVRLRGDINVLLMGDPSTAKSQFLKFVQQVAPIGVYTSGKGSSAAGLTASVIKDGKGEFYLEGGAMVLADGGVICIDEFDKMRETDRVAIHEAMEQQTISVAKAGITTMLNCRNSVLAAANPIHGRYDDLRDVGDNINLMSTILSRFDCIFIVRDVRELQRDREIARHVLGVHINTSLAQHTSSLSTTSAAATGNSSSGRSNSSTVTGETAGIIPPTVLKKFIAFVRDRCAPRLSDEAAALLNGQYVHIRNQVRQSLLQRQRSQQSEAQVVPITIRQLEAIVRLSESLAKMRLSAEANVVDVEEALRLFKVSTLAASLSNPVIMQMMMTGGLNSNGSNSNRDAQLAEEFLKRRMSLRATVSTKKLIEEGEIQGYSNDLLRVCIRAMVLRNELQELHHGKLIRRIR